MSKCRVFLTSAVVVALLTSFARASLVDFSSDAQATEWNSSGVVITQQISSSPAVTTMSAEFAPPPGMSSTGASYSTFSVDLEAVNDLGWTWTGYLLDLDPTGNASFVAGSYSSSAFGNIEEGQMPYQLGFSTPPGSNVLPGQSVHFYFDIRISGSSSYTFELTQTPVPEPATMAFLGIGALALVIRRRPS